MAVHPACWQDRSWLSRRSAAKYSGKLGGYREADACTWAHELVPSCFVLWNIASVPWHR
jgi:hypothetical protein